MRAIVVGTDHSIGRAAVFAAIHHTQGLGIVVNKKEEEIKIMNSIERMGHYMLAGAAASRSALDIYLEKLEAKKIQNAKRRIGMAEGKKRRNRARNKVARASRRANR